MHAVVSDGSTSLSLDGGPERGSQAAGLLPPPKHSIGPWRATRYGFSFSDETVRGQLTFRRDAPGLRRVSPRVGTRPSTCASPVLLAVRTVQAANRPAFTVAPSGTALESRMRGRLVDVQLEAGKRCPVRMHLYWQAAPSQLDLEILASSADPLENAEVLTMSCHAAGEVLVRASRRGTGWVSVHDALALGAEWLIFPRDRVAGIKSLDGRYPSSDHMAIAGFYRQPIVLYRPAGQHWSYVEMSQPHDCVRVVAHVGRQRTGMSFGLFGLDLEKGVILRGRVRGMFLPRANDTRSCLRQFARFAAESPRLSV